MERVPPAVTSKITTTHRRENAVSCAHVYRAQCLRIELNCPWTEVEGAVAEEEEVGLPTEVVAQF
jgi:hypothetical protein